MNKSNYSQIEEKFWDMFQILGYFGQEAESFTQGTASFLENTTADIKRSLEKVNEFLKNKEVSDDEKRKFLREEIFLSFSSFQDDPLKWLKDFANQIEEHLKMK